MRSLSGKKFITEVNASPYKDILLLKRREESKTVKDILRKFEFKEIERLMELVAETSLSKNEKFANKQAQHSHELAIETTLDDSIFQKATETALEIYHSLLPDQEIDCKQSQTLSRLKDIVQQWRGQITSLRISDEF